MNKILNLNDHIKAVKSYKISTIGIQILDMVNENKTKWGEVPLTTPLGLPIIKKCMCLAIKLYPEVSLLKQDQHQLGSTLSLWLHIPNLHNKYV